MVCPVCGKKSQYNQCPECGFDSSRDYEKYPTLVPVGKTPAVSARRKAWNAKKQPDEVLQRKRPWLALIACVAMLVIGIGIGVGLGGGKPAPTEPSENVQLQAPPETTHQTVPPETTELTTPSESTAPLEFLEANILRDDRIPNYKRWDEPSSYSIMGSKYKRYEIKSVTFLDTLADAPEDAWDVSAAGNEAVMAWVKPNGEHYDLYIGAEGGVWAGKSCRELFAWYRNVEHINFNNAFHTDGAEDMYRMFYYCGTLTELDVGSFITSNVKDMTDMFLRCDSLMELDLSSFDTSNVQNMDSMFADCIALTELDLSNFDTSNVRSMSGMFLGCSSLTDINLSSFNTSNVQNMTSMFGSCSSLTELNLSNFDTSNVTAMSCMFYNCESLTSLILGNRFVTQNADTDWIFFKCPAGDDWQHLLK